MYVIKKIHILINNNLICMHAVMYVLMYCVCIGIYVNLIISKF